MPGCQQYRPGTWEMYEPALQAASVSAAEGRSSAEFQVDATSWSQRWWHYRRAVEGSNQWHAHTCGTTPCPSLAYALRQVYFQQSWFIPCVTSRNFPTSSQTTALKPPRRAVRGPLFPRLPGVLPTASARAGCPATNANQLWPVSKPSLKRPWVSQQHQNRTGLFGSESTFFIAARVWC